MKLKKILIIIFCVIINAMVFSADQQTIYENTLQTGITTQEISTAFNVLDKMGDEKNTDTKDNNIEINKVLEQYQEKNIKKEIEAKKTSEEKNSERKNTTLYSDEKEKVSKSLWIKYFEEYENKKNNLNIFGYSILKKGMGISLPTAVGKDYIIGVGDNLNIKIWDDYSNSKTIVFQTSIESTGELFIANMGIINTLGKSISKLEKEIRELVRQKMSNVNVDISLIKMRDISVNVIGEVSKPGVKKVPPTSNIMDAITMAEGITTNAGIRNIIIKNRTEERIFDLYEYLAGKKSLDEYKISEGDTVFIPVAINTLRIIGEVYNPGIYELKNEKTANDILKLAGGVKSTSDITDIVIKYVSNDQINVKNIKSSEDAILEKNLIEIFVGKINDDEKKSILVLGSVINPGIYEYKDGVSIRSSILSAGGFTKDASIEYANVFRANKDNSYTVISVDLNKENIELKSKDKVIIYDLNDINKKKYATISGNINNPGVYEIYDGLKLKDLLLFAHGIKTQVKTCMERADIFRISKTGKIEIISVNLEKAMENDIENNIVINRNDVVEIYKHEDFIKYDDINIYGEVYSPGRYNYYEEMTIRDIVFHSKGFKTSASTEIEIVRRINGNFESKMVDYRKVPNFKLKPNDQIFVRKQKDWETLKIVKITGYVNYPGEYFISDNETINSIIDRAGGFKKGALPEGIELRRYESSVATLREMNMEKDFMLEQERNAKYNMKLNNIKYNKKNGKYYGNILLNDRDEIAIPEFKNQIKIVGEVYNPGLIVYNDSMTNMNDYIQMAGGLKEEARIDKIFVIAVDGVVKKPGFFNDIRIEAGDTIVVPTDTRKEKGWDGILNTVRSVSEAILASVLIYNIVK